MFGFIKKLFAPRPKWRMSARDEDTFYLEQYFPTFGYLAVGIVSDEKEVEELKKQLSVPPKYFAQ